MVHTQNDMCYKMVFVTKWYITKQYMLLNDTFFILYYECTKPRIIGTFV
jgi:hypothetical protein